MSSNRPMVPRRKTERNDSLHSFLWSLITPRYPSARLQPDTGRENPLRHDFALIGGSFGCNLGTEPTHLPAALKIYAAMSAS